jgi:FKBP-type peptidyl-prolyl cis-trans isomerase FkpA
MKRAILLMAMLAAAGCGSANSVSPSTTSSAPYSQVDVTVGTGATATAGHTVTVNYILWLYDSSKADGKGTQVQANNGYPFVLGTGAVIAGWDQGVPGMKVGGLRRLVIPPELAYGSNPPSSSIPVNATLVFDITLTAVS